ncbi:hypothetical protein HJG60_009832 [Phyllostomus discolor]|uniref:Uncharacterized protein n=1 Tax=Phyllostomus discolor TaxID=89673 RepID=A0A834B3F2_9CHIR|nr:hypothetical protein HJG60_009832 [Phyllostomus discolor]
MGAGENYDPQGRGLSWKNPEWSRPHTLCGALPALGEASSGPESPAPWALEHSSQDAGQGFRSGPLLPPGTRALTASCLLSHRPAGSQVASALFLRPALPADQCRGHPSWALGLKGRPSAPLLPNALSPRTAWHSEPLHLPL